MNPALLLEQFSINEIKLACASDWLLIKQTLPSNQSLEDKKQIIDIVIRLYGTSILEIVDFRELFLRTK